MKETKEPETEELYLSKVSRESRELEFDTVNKCHKLKVFVKDKSRIKGCSCFYCKTPIEAGEYSNYYDEIIKIYFCPKLNIFMHKCCLIPNHKTEDICTMEDNEHSDYAVDVEFIEISNNE
jgi:hypothetical protein